MQTRVFSALTLRRLAGAGVCLCVLAFAGCTEANNARRNVSGPQKVTVWGADGKAIREYTAEGRVLSEDNSDGWYFVDSKTHKLVIVTGTLTIEEQ